MGRRTARRRERQVRREERAGAGGIGWRPVAAGVVVVLIGIPLLVLGGGAVLGQIGSQPSTTPSTAASAQPLPTLAPITNLPPMAPPVTIDVNRTYTAVFGTRFGPVSVLLQPKWAPQTVNGFIYLAEKHYWDGQYVFKRVAGANGDYLELGDRSSTGSGVGPYALPAETPPPGVTLSSGTVAMDFQPGAPFFESANLLIFNIGDNTAALSAPVAGHKPVHNVFGQVTSGFISLQRMSRGDQIFTVRVTPNP